MVRVWFLRVTRLIEEALAVGRAAETRDPVGGAVFALEFVVVRELVICYQQSVMNSFPHNTMPVSPRRKKGGIG